jgi:nitrite reductase (cytochrome c-552)
MAKCSRHPGLASESLTGSIAASKAGVKILNYAMAVVKKDGTKK